MAADDDPLLSLRARRRILVALGYGATAGALLGLSGFRPSRLVGGGDLVDLTAQEAQPPAAPSAEIPVLDQAATPPADGHRYGIAIVNGRVIDPETGFDAVISVGIDDGVITTIGSGPLDADTVIDATGLVVAPGFIDLLSYEPNPFGVWFKLADGVTTNLAMHGVNNYATAFFDRYEGTSPIHFGGAFHHHFMRGADLGVGVEDQLSAAEQRRIERLARENLEAGFAGVSFSPEYSPGTTSDEMEGLARIAVQAGHLSFFHTRYSDPYEPGTSAEGIAEVLELARVTSSAVHIEHITSTGGTFVMAETLDTLDRARSDGIDVTACLYPYDYWGTFLASSRFAAGWQERYGLGYEDLQVAGTDRRLSASTFAEAVDDNLLVAALGSIPEDEIQLALTRPWVMIGSDAILEPALNNHPRGAGTFCRTLARYVRELGVLDLRTALAKMTVDPARRVEKMLPDLARKGRLQIGADADIVVFDPATVADRATVAAPDQASVGIRWVLVEGRIALADGEARRDVRAGRALRSTVSG